MDIKGLQKLAKTHQGAMATHLLNFNCGRGFQCRESDCCALFFPTLDRYGGCPKCKSKEKLLVLGEDELRALGGVRCLKEGEKLVFPEGTPSWAQL
jgi:hypothetical protein